MKNETMTSPPLPENLDEQQSQILLNYWPAWNLTEAANLEIGSRVLIIGSGELARSVLRLCDLRGCLHRALCGPSALADDAELQMDALRPLPQQPDAIFILENVAAHLPTALLMCAQAGTIVFFEENPTSVDLNFYSDAHKRGLFVSAVSLAGFDNGEKSQILLSRLILCGVLKD